MSATRPAVGAGAFSRTTVIALILVGVFSFSAYVVLSAYAPLLREGNDGGGHALSKSAVGYAFLAALLEENGVTVLAPRGALPETRDGLLVYTPRDLEQMADLESIDEYQITIIVPPKWNVAPDLQKSGWVRRAGMTRLKPLTITAGETAFSFEFARREGVSQIIVEPADAVGGMITRSVPSRNIGSIDRLQYLKPADNLEPILMAGNGEIVFAKVKDLPFYLLSDADLANTHGLSGVARATVAAGIFDFARAGGPVVFDLSLHDIERTRNIIRLALEPPFLAATLCALFGTLLLALKAAMRFGPIRSVTRPFDAGKAALADNSAALIRMAKRENAFGGRYADLIRRRIAKAIGAPKTMTSSGLDTLIDSIGAERRNVKFTSLVNDICMAGDGASFVRAARRLHQFEREIIRDHR